MEKPESAWQEHPIQKIYGTFTNYALARKKLKDAEDLSDINSGTDRDEILKKSRKIRAAKVFDDITSSNDELSDENSLILELPQIPQKHAATITETMKEARMSQKGAANFNYVNIPNYVNNSQRKKNIKLKDTRCIEKKSNDNFSIQCDNEDFIEQSFETYLDEGSVSEDSFIETSTQAVPIRLTNVTSKSNLNCTENNNMPIQLTSVTSKSNLNCMEEIENQRFQRFVVSKVISLELKINSIEKHQKRILEKFPISNFEEGEQIVDIFGDLPLRNENDLQAMKTKLNNDLPYRNQMIKQLAYVICQDLKTSCINIMKKLLSNDVRYSWYGAKKKENFSQLQICKVMMCAIRNMHKNATDEQISGPIKIWLAHAKERLQKQTLV